MRTNTEDSVAIDNAKRQFVTFRIRSKRYGVPIESVAEMTQVEALYPISGAPSWILGMMQLRDSVVPILDLRLRLGFPRLIDELEALSCQIMRHRDDHLEWIDAVAASQLRRDASSGPRPSRSCGLRVWMDGLGPDEDFAIGTSDRLRGPDERLHGLVESSLDRSALGDGEGARRLLERARGGELKELLQGFDGAMRELESRGRQMVVILQGEEEDLAVAVDHIDSVASVGIEQIVPRPLQALESREEAADLLVSSVVRRHDDSDLIQILDVCRLFRSAGVGGATRVESQGIGDGASGRPESPPVASAGRA